MVGERRYLYDRIPRLASHDAKRCPLLALDRAAQGEGAAELR